MIQRLLFVATFVSFSAAFAQTSKVSIVPNPSTTTAISAEENPTNESTIKMGNVLGNKKFEDDKDITDSKLKADSGSLSRYSLKFAFSYYGPPIGDLSNEKQPNPDGSIGNTDTAVGGSMSFRYRLDSKSAISAGTGINVLTPMQGSKRTDIKQPFASYDRNSRIGDFQVRNSYGAAVVTQPEYLDVGEYGGLSYDNSFVYNFGTSGFAAGIDSSFNYYLFNRGWEKADRNAQQYTLGFYPQVKYNITDKTNVYSSLALGFQNFRSNEDRYSLMNKTLSARLGMGMAFTRDIYFAPYLNFYPKDLKTESTTISFATVFSIL
jgi:hypothetical protein